MKRCRRYRLWSLRGRINRCGRVGGAKHLSAGKLLERINSSCSSGRERRKSVSGMIGRLIWAAYQGNLEMVKYCVANECPIDEDACAYAAENGHLECLKYLHEEAKAPWDSDTATWAAQNGHLHILEYLVERKYDKYDELACMWCGRERPLGLFEVLARNRQSALGRCAVRYAHREQPPRVFTIPPRQRLSSTNRLVSRRRNFTHLINTHTHKEREGKN